MSSPLDRILIDAAEIGAVNVVKAAIQDGANVNAVANCSTALYQAVCGKHAGIVQTLLENGAKSDKPRLLIAAAKRKDIETLGLLLDAGVDINAQDPESEGTTALMICRDEETTRFLIKRGADVNIVRRDKSTALMFAIGDLNLELVKLLVENGADLFCDSESRDALAFAASTQVRHPEIIKFLVDKMFSSAEVS